MRVGIVKEIKQAEYRVAMHAAGVAELTGRGHEVLVETGAGVHAGITDAAYVDAGATIVQDPDTVWEQAELLLKVKEPLPEEYGRMRKDQILFTYLHLAASRECTVALLEAGTTSVAYEMVRGSGGTLPLLAPMSQVAGRLAAQVAAYHLMAPYGGSGVLLGGVPGTRRAKVLVVGGGVVGEQAAVMASGLGADVTIVDVNPARLSQLDTVYGGRIATRFSTAHDIAALATDSDVVIGAVLIPGKQAPKLLTRPVIESMRPGSIVVDVAIDQGGCTEVSRPTTHAEPTFRVGQTTMYCVANMPGAVSATSTAALANATLPYVLRLADGGLGAIASDPGLRAGLSTHAGALLHEEVAEAHEFSVTTVEVALAAL
ncbi:MAG: alanine dehydrogenase [Dermabacter sp.]|nr:alanine dehydrogenase [Dermabacter sp.]